MANIFDVAKYILAKKGEVSTWKLQKLCYYCQAWTLAWTNTPLFNEDFEAWTNGPVCPSLFYAHQGQFLVRYDHIKTGDEKNLSADEIDSIETVLETYGDMMPYMLRESTHREKPWIEAREGCKEDERCRNVISKDSMALYYGGL